MLNISKIQLLNNNFLNNSFFKNWNLKLTFFYSFIVNQIILWHIDPIILNIKKLTEILKKIISYGYKTYVLYDNFILSRIITRDKQISSYFFYRCRKGFLTNFSLIFQKKKKKKKKRRKLLKKLFPSFIFCLDIEQEIQLQYIIRECNKIELPLGALISKNFNFWGISYPLYINVKALSSIYFFYKFIKQLIILGLCLAKINFLKIRWQRFKNKIEYKKKILYRNKEREKKIKKKCRNKIKYIKIKKKEKKLKESIKKNKENVEKTKRTIQQVNKIERKNKNLKKTWLKSSNF